MSAEQLFRDYLTKVDHAYRMGNATEHTYRPYLKDLLEALGNHITATNEPRRVACGAPDYVISREERTGHATIGYVEAKDIGVSLTETLKTDQLDRYRRALENLVLTDYLEFRWFLKGEQHMTVRLAEVKNGHVVADHEGMKKAEDLLVSFLGQSPELIRSPRDLAQRMARLTHMIRDLAMESFARKSASDMLIGLYDSFKQVLIPDLAEPDFADMFAQTLAYGLFAARSRHNGASGPFRREDAAREIPKTNPFLRRLFAAITGPDLDDEPFAGFVDDLTQLLARADMEAILADFGHRTRQEDPIVHFYETFLTAYDPKLRELRGVYYTPEPVVSYIVRSVDAILKRDFGLAEGLADSGSLPPPPNPLPLKGEGEPEARRTSAASGSASPLPRKGEGPGEGA
ncbi:MAG TPA: hypothetical protein VFX24_12425, partial [Ktedonobacterales bacterium]|nr:hypothetical protein [Ktedonobacterales bacterium]